MFCSVVDLGDGGGGFFSGVGGDGCGFGGRDGCHGSGGGSCDDGDGNSRGRNNILAVVVAATAVTAVSFQCHY